VSLNLASVFAMQNFKVIVVGMDLRKPKLFQDVGVTNDVGMSTYLIGQATLEQVIKKTGISNLDLIPAGPVPPNPAELIAKNEMKEFFATLKKMYDYIIVDTAPLGIVSDAYMLVKFSDINMYIAREGVSKKEFIRTLNDVVDEGKIQNVCLLLNDSDFNKSYGYSYGHNYGYTNRGSGYYEDDGGKKNLLSRIFSRS
jgi:capsular exopolysaccharide synthesis family protein